MLGPAALERPHQRERQARRPRDPRLEEGRAAPGARQRDRRHLPGADDGAEPGLHRGLADHRDTAHPLRHHSERGEGAGSGAARPGRAARSPEGLQLVSAPALRRPASARHDRPVHLVRSVAPDRGRADHSARRDRAGRDPRPHARPPPPSGFGDPADHPRHGRRRRPRRRHRGDAQGRDRRARHGRGRLRRPAASVHAPAAGRRAAHRPGRRCGDRHDRRTDRRRDRAAPRRDRGARGR